MNKLPTSSTTGWLNKVPEVALSFWPSWRAPASLTSIRLERFWKSYTLNGPEKRAVPLVGSTWLGPAQ